MTVRESPDELMLRADEVRTLKAHVNVDHRKRKMGSFWLITTGMLSVRRCVKASNEKIGKNCLFRTKR